MANVLVIGSGGREHAIVRALANDADVEHVFCAPGNGGTAAMTGVSNVATKDKRDLVALADREEIDLIIVGPEVPLVEGLVDFFRAHELRVFGFKKSAAQLEGSKVYAKRFMQKYSIPTAPFRVFESYRQALVYLEEHFQANPQGGFFIKADELCGGKGAIHAPDLESGRQALQALFKEKRCGVGKHVIVEELLSGQEASVFALTDGKSVATLPPAQDHKTAYDGDRGPNTGGMGAYAPALGVTEEVYDRIEQEVILPTLFGMEEERISDGGVLYLGLMIDRKGKPSMLEYNVRFGDPEAQPILALLKSDLYPILRACTEGKLGQAEIEWKEGVAVCVVLSVSGYPDVYDYQNEEIHGIEEAEALRDVYIYHAGTEFREGRFFTKGGRILGVTGIGKDVATAQKRAYQAVSKISFQGMHYRTDIAGKALQ
ncbi:MAG: phosphoribosylamine--glycine ligase [Candidatus Fraserbacteria bacterium RBG_16_55_9]|uniref:Phosphoribosylamine--glycine ligase n=1 Tax=Fraserbacteria sp. (strain RBG_16_55_9) TaxID=1817864 RepID=A0A1F5UQ40_FRAXR|nr:MAG: phosphoribosylamine--glycine ligase [Candidatus Fraserbacteria bacterium RBG_16_55_9]